MLDSVSMSNELQTFVHENNLDRRSVTKWVSVNDSEKRDFPKLDETLLRLLTLGTYQLKLSSSYVQEYIGGECEFQLYQEQQGLLRVRLQSHILVTFKYVSSTILF